jgi:RNase H-like domain found in reverse transcriptase/Reverse transcriptase (RNA-dependent DNA polymerase)
MYRFKTMPLELMNARTTFQRLMDNVLAGLHLEMCLVYLDDTVVFSETESQNLEGIAAVCDRLRSAGLKLKPKKSSLIRKSVSFLGHVISDQGIETDPAKIKAVTVWPIPTCSRNVGAILGLSRFYRRCVKNVAKIATPLHVLVKKNSHYCWVDEADRSFRALKSSLTSLPTLATPNNSDPLALNKDASNYAISAILLQKRGNIERVIAYPNRAPNRRGQNYCVIRREMLAVMHFLKHIQQYLLGQGFIIRTDHAALSWLRHTSEPMGRQARWHEQLDEFNFTVEYRP